MALEMEHTVLDSGVQLLALSGTMSMGNLLQKFEWTLGDLVKKQQHRIVVDISQITYVDSSAIGVLVNCHSVVKNAGGQLRIAGATERVDRLLKMTGVDALLVRDPTRAAAVAALSQQA
jgi:anti-anti-sigma factor